MLFLKSIDHNSRRQRLGTVSGLSVAVSANSPLPRRHSLISDERPDPSRCPSVDQTHHCIISIVVAARVPGVRGYCAGCDESEVRD